MFVLNSAFLFIHLFSTIENRAKMKDIVAEKA